MRTLDASLIAVINAHTRRPAVTLTAEDHIQHLNNFQSPNGQDAWCDACIAADNSIIRCYVSRGDSPHAFQQTAYVQRITDPLQTAQWTTWTTLGGSANIMNQDGGIACSNNPSSSNTLRVFAQKGTGGNDVLNWFSTDNGATWSVGPGIVATPPGGALTKGISSAGNNDCFFMYDVTGGDSMGAVFFTGAWSTIHTWPFTPLTNAAGLAAAWIPASGLYYIVHTDSYGLYNVNYNPGSNTWGGMGDKPVTPATNTAVGRISPRVSFFDNVYSLICIETDSGLLTQSVYSYPRVRQSGDMIHWSNGFPLHALQPTNYGANYFKLTAPQTGASGGRYYVTTQVSVYTNKIYDPNLATKFVDVSGSVLQFVRSEQINKPNKLVVIIDNAQGVYNGLVSTAPGGPYAPMGKNTTLVLSEGYKVGTPPVTNDVILVGKYRVNDVKFLRSPEANYIQLVAYDITKNLDLEARWQLTWANQNVGWLITEVCARAGIFSVSVPGTFQVNQTIVSFTLHAGQTYRKALDELCATYGLVYFLDQNETLQFRELSTGDASQWAYSPEIELVSFGTIEVRANHVIVSGKPPTGGASGALLVAEAYDDINVQDIGTLERLLHYSDPKLTTLAQCSAKATFIMAQEARGQVRHQVTVPDNPGLQINDIVTLTDSNAPTGSGQAGNARIVALNVQFDALRAMYDLHMLCEGV